MRNFYLTVTLVLVVFLQLNAALFTWTGGGAINDWNDPANWDVGTVPTATDDVVITGSSTIVTLNTPFTVESVEIKSGGTLIVGPAGVLNLGNDDGTDTNGALDLSSSSGTIINNGTIIVTNASEDGIDSRGTFTNNGTIMINGFGNDGLSIEDASSVGGIFTNNGTIDVIFTGGGDDGVQVDDNGATLVNNGILNVSSSDCTGDIGIFLDDNAFLINNATGVVNVSDTVDEGLFIDTNSQADNFGFIGTANSGICAGSGNHGLEVRGTFNNNAGATYKDVNSRGDAIRIEDAGILNNAGTLTIDITSGVTSDAFQNENDFNGLTGCVLEIGCVGTINELEVNDGDLNIGACCVNFDIAGPGSGGSDFDRFDIRNTVLDISGATAKLAFDAAYTPVIGDCFKIVDGHSDGSGTVGGQFAAITSNNPAILLEVDYTDPTEVEVCILSVDASLSAELVAFRGVKSDDNALLSWKTASEQNNAGFEIQSSTDSRNWTKIGYAEGNGTTTDFNTYRFEDANPANGFNYYRLKQLDLDGNFEYSETVALEFAKTDKEIIISTYPNPVRDVLNIEINQSSDDMEVELLDLNGSVLFRHTGMIKQIPFSEYPTGIYYLRIVNQTEETTHKVFKTF